MKSNLELELEIGNLRATLAGVGGYLKASADLGIGMTEAECRKMHREIANVLSPVVMVPVNPAEITSIPALKKD